MMEDGRQRSVEEAGGEREERRARSEDGEG